MGFPLLLPSVLLYVFTVIILLRVLVISFCVFFSLLAFSPLSLCPFSGFLFCFSFAASSSRSLSLPPSPLSSCYFLAFPSSALFSSSFGFSFLPSSPLPHPPFRSRYVFFFSLLWPLFLGFILGFLYPFSSCLSFSSSFVLSPLLSSSFVSVSFHLPSSSLHSGYSSFSSVLAASLVGSSSSSLPSSPLAFAFSQSAFLGCSGLLCVSRVGVFSPGVLLSYLCLCLLSSSLVGSFLCLCFCFCLLLGSSFSSLFCASSFYYSSTWILPVASAAVPLSPAPSSSASLYFARSSVLSLPLFSSALGGGADSGAVTALPRQS